MSIQISFNFCILFRRNCMNLVNKVFIFLLLPYYTIIIQPFARFVNSLQVLWKRFHFCAKVYELLLLLSATVGHLWCPHQTVREARSPSPDLYCNKKHHKPGGRCQKKFSENVFIPPGGRQTLQFSPNVSAFIGDK